MKPLRVAFVCVVPSPYQRDLLAALSQREEVELTVYYMERSAPDSPWPEKPLAAYEHYLPGFWFRLGSRRVHLNWPLPSFAKYDVVVLNTLMSITAQWIMRFALREKQWLFWGERLPRLAGEDPQCRLQKESFLYQTLVGCLSKSAGIAAIGSWALPIYRSLFPKVQHFNIPYFCDLEPFSSEPKVQAEDRSITFFFCGQMIGRKGLDNLLEAFRHLPGSPQLLLVGREGELPALLSTLPAHVRSRIEYAGFQAPEDLPKFFARADVFVLPSRYDGWGVVVNQAIAAGLPLLCSDRVGAWYDLGESHINGEVFAAGDAVDLQRKMQLFLDGGETIGEYGRASRVKAREWQPASGAARWVAALQAVSA